jgi:hypothetical protein
MFLAQRVMARLPGEGQDVLFDSLGFFRRSSMFGGMFASSVFSETDLVVVLPRVVVVIVQVVQLCVSDVQHNHEKFLTHLNTLTFQHEVVPGAVLSSAPASDLKRFGSQWDRRGLY